MATAPGNLHNIINGINMGKEEEDEEERSPTKKCRGSSKSSTKRSAHKVSPPEPTTTNKSISFSNKKIPHICEHKLIVLESTNMLKGEFPFKQFTKSLVSLLSNAQTVDLHFTINPLDPISKEGNIIAKGDISLNMTKLGTHIKILGSGHQQEENLGE
jgi:hypothetical protein